MEAAAVSAVVSMTLKVVGNKLVPLLIKESSFVVGVKRDLQELQNQVEDINIWLETRDFFMWNDPTFKWLKRLKDVSYAVDDVVDEFQLKAELQEASTDGGIVSKYTSIKPKSFIFQFKAARKIKAVKKNFAAIVKQRADFSAIANSLPVSHPFFLEYSVPISHLDHHITRTSVGMSSLTNVDEDLVLGRNQEKYHIISKLVEANYQQKFNIVSVIGLGGSGKTTVARLVSNDDNIIKKHFKTILWVHALPEFGVENLVRELFESFNDYKSEYYSMQNIVKKISDKLSEGKFLLVLDNIWIESRIQWEEFMVYLKSGAAGSAILVTTRNRKVAEAVRSTYIYDLPFLSKDASWQLFQQSLVMPVEDLDSNLVKIGKEIMNKCGGVPLAIKVLAGVLHDKEQIQEWIAIRDNNILDVEDEEHRVAVCLMLSYYRLPSHLKNCFTICSLFPKGHRIDKEQLIDQWIAHDMMTPVDGVDNLEYIGHKYFNSLVQVSLLQDVDEYNGRVRCRMHDLAHDLARYILRDEISVDLPQEATSSTKGYRYFSIIKGSRNLTPVNCFRKARAIYVDKGDNLLLSEPLKKAKHLRSIAVKYISTTTIPTTIFQVKNLKYLHVSGLRCETLSESLSNIWSLQALHVTHCFHLLELPKSLGKLQKLRTLNMSWCTELKCLPDSVGDCNMISSIDLCGCKKITVLPNSISKLQKLEKLNMSLCTKLKCLPDSIGDCNMISSIDLRCCIEITVLPNSISKLQKLEKLNLSRCKELKCLPDSIGSCCPMISSIDLHDCIKLTVLPNFIGSNKRLRVLRLGKTKIKRLPSSITTLTNLECLDLHLCLELLELPEGIGNLKNLQVLNLKDCYKLVGMPVGIGHLSRLQILGLFTVGEGEKFARISELGNVPRISEELSLKGISHGMDPNDAHKACLKQKTNLQRLDLRWMQYCTGDEVSTELVQGALDGLEPPTGIKKLVISGYSGRQYAQWMKNQVGGARGPAPFPFLRVLELRDFPNLKHLDGLVELPCLDELKLARMPSLESISGGPFHSLVKLAMIGLPNLGELWIVSETERTLPDREEGGGCRNFTSHDLGRQVRVGSGISELYILDCAKLKVMPYLPLSLQHMSLTASSQHLLQSPSQCQESSSFSRFSRLKELDLWELSGLGSGCGWDVLQHMTALESLGIKNSHGLAELPESFRSLSLHLQSMVVFGCFDIRRLPEWLGEFQSLQKLTIQCCTSLSALPESMGHLTSLQELHIDSCLSLHQLPKCLGELLSLRTLRISMLYGLTCLPQSICGLTSLKELHVECCRGINSLPQGMKGLTSLEKLSLFGCPGIKSLPEGIKGLTALKELEIKDCPHLVRRCERATGEDWHLISHIPYCSIW